MKRGFTLIELIMTIGILAILMATAVVVINPVEYLRQSRDTKRVGDIHTIDKAIESAIANSPNIAQGAVQTVYVSLPDTATNCPTLIATLPTLPTGWSYYCASQANYRKTNGTGWIPVNFDGLPAKSPLTALPTDPTNDVSKGLYYMYISGGSYALSATLESEKYLKQSAVKDGGYDPSRIEQGSDLELLATAGQLAGYWPFDEGSGAVAIDGSGNGNNGTIYGATSRVTGKINKALQFTGVGDYVGSATAPQFGTNPFTFLQWIKTSSANGQMYTIANAGGGNGYRFGLSGGRIAFLIGDSGTYTEATCGTATVNDGQWHLIAGVFDRAANTFKCYKDGAFVASVAMASVPTMASDPAPRFGNTYCCTAFNGALDEVRIYKRALSATEIMAMYNATK